MALPIPKNAQGGGNFSEIKSRLLFVLGALLVFRIGTFIPVPGIDPQALQALFEQQQGTILDMVNMFSGGALGRVAIFALGIMPYISASIIIQLLSASEIVPHLARLRKEGESGRRKITQYTRYATLVLGTFQALGIAIALESQQPGGVALVMDPGLVFRFTAVITLVTGTMFLMWLGEQVTERGIGNGISLIIFAGIVAELPGAIGGTLELARTGEMSPIVVLLLFVLAIVITAFVVFVERGQRRITINYAKRQQGRKVYAGQTSHLPLKVNSAGVIPAILASAIILFPGSISLWFGQSGNMEWLQDLSSVLSPGQLVYYMLFVGAIIFFCFFYTALIIKPKELADNLKKSGAFIPGIRPGEQTAGYIDSVLTRLTTVGAIYIAAVCLLPDILIQKLNAPFYFGGTSLLIIVVVSMDFMTQLQSHMMSHQYEGLMKKANLKGYGKSGAIR